MQLFNLEEQSHEMNLFSKVSIKMVLLPNSTVQYFSLLSVFYSFYPSLGAGKIRQNAKL